MQCNKEQLRQNHCNINAIIGIVSGQCNMTMKAHDNESSSLSADNPNEHTRMEYTVMETASQQHEKCPQHQAT
jgi:hypothetical protein